jgi:hypothetical protein
MDYRTTSTVREFRAGVLSPGGWSGAAAMAGQPYGLSRSLARCAFVAGMSRKPDGGEGTAWSSLHPAGPPEEAGSSPLQGLSGLCVSLHPAVCPTAPGGFVSVLFPSVQPSPPEVQQ